MKIGGKSVWKIGFSFGLLRFSEYWSDIIFCESFGVVFYNFG
jgi:hypothetical protein